MKVGVQQSMSYNWGRHRNRLRKGKRGTNLFYQKSPYKSLRAAYRPIYNKHRRTTPKWGGLQRAWIGYVIAKSQDDYEKMRKYAIVIRKFERRLNIAINDFPEIGIYGFEEDFENKEGWFCLIYYSGFFAGLKKRVSIEYRMYARILTSLVRKYTLNRRKNNPAENKTLDTIG